MANSLKKQIAVFLILPVTLLLVFGGFAGFFYARNMLLEQWRQGAILRLERAAHHIDMCLGRPVEWIEMFHQTAVYPGAGAARDFILTKLENLEGVTSVRLIQSPEGYNPGGGLNPAGEGQARSSFKSFGRGALSQITPPQYDAKFGHETITLISEFQDSKGLQHGRLEVALRFDYLLEDIEALGWWQSQQVCLVDTTGRYLAHSSAMQGRRQLGETLDPVETEVFEQMRQKPYGTIMGKGHPPDMVSGFYSLQRAPWVLIMYAPGKQILGSIIRFRFYYAIAGAVFIGIIILLIHYAAGRMVKRIRRVSQAFEHVKKGMYNHLLPASSTDEIGLLEAGFNDMTEALKERDVIRDTFGRYVDPEIARDLLNRPGAAGLGGEKREVAILIFDFAL
jgi:HAMP domain-containing protein